jgi:hypothetical protein
MKLQTNVGADPMASLTTWCGECNAQKEFDQVPEGTGVEYACRCCSAAMFAGELPLIESILQPVVASAHELSWLSTHAKWAAE